MNNSEKNSVNNTKKVPEVDPKKVPEVDLEELTECPECDSAHIVRDYKRGEVTCRNCGLVVDDQVIDQ